MAKSRAKFGWRLKTPLKPPDWRWLTAVGLTVLLLALISIAVRAPDAPVRPWLLLVVAASVGGFYLMFPGTRFFALAFANFLGVYLCLFVFFMEANFRGVSGMIVPIGYLLPILAFFAGAAMRRAEIARIISADRLRDRHRLGRVFGWLAPVFLIGALTFLIPGAGLSHAGIDAAFLIAMALIALIVFMVSPDVGRFLLDSGLLFEEFFHRIAGLTLPAFAFLTFYSLVVIVFGVIFRIVDIVTEAAQFQILGAAREISFVESLYFSIITLSTVGYGEIVPLTDLVRLLISVEIVVGVVLLLFGFSEIIAYRRERRPHEKD